MRRTNRKLKAYVEKAFVETLPWHCTNFGNTSEVDAFIEKTGRWETIAETHSIGNVLDAEDVAEYIVDCSNRHGKMLEALKLARVCLEQYLRGKELGAKTKSSVEQALKGIDVALSE